MATKKEQKQIAKWEKEYKKGAHWEKRHSKNMKEFIKYLKGGDKILDIGCGSGRDSIFLAKQGFAIWGIDVSKEAIKKAKKKFKAENLHFAAGDIQKLQFENEFFDAIYSGWVLQAVPLEKALSEIFRVLRKGGIAFLAFLLNQKIVATGIVKEFCKKESILSAYKKSKLKILKQIEFEERDLAAEKPHTHDVLILVLKK